MKEVQFIMGMPVILQTPNSADESLVGRVFSYFKAVDQRFSTFKEDSEISRINSKLIGESVYSDDMKLIFKLATETKLQTDGYFDIINRGGNYDPSGIVKGWAIYQAGNILLDGGVQNFYLEAGGDIQVHGSNENNKGWAIGIRNPFKPEEIIKTVQLNNNEGIATSGSYERGNHIYNPKNRQEEMKDIVSLTVIGPNILEADRFATAAFAMQQKGIGFMENLKGFEAYMIDKNGMATMTSGFEKYTHG